MKKLLLFRQKIKQFYGNYDAWITPVIKALVMLLIILVLDAHFGYSKTIMQWNIVLLALLTTALLPWHAITFVSAFYLLVQLFNISWEVAAVAAIFLFIAVLLQYVFLPGCSLAIALIPAFYYLHIPYVIPLVLGLVSGITGFIPAGMGVFIYYFVAGIEKNADFFLRTSGSNAELLERFPQIFSIIKDNSIMLISITAFSITCVVVSIIRRHMADYAPYIAVAVGAIVNIMIFLVGGFISDTQLPYVEIIIGNVISFVLACMAAFWITASDYNHTEYLQFEDEGYIYHVKAIPKIKIAQSEKKVHDITLKPEDIKEEIKTEKAGNKKRTERSRE